jgi:glycosyltransferase involved in cell wall biosynthesis
MLLSVVIPCLNEEETLGICIDKCLIAFKRLGIDKEAEIVVADNGSNDNSVKSAKIINVEKKGYGSALINGIKAAQGKFIIMGDADNSYDFNELDNFYLKLLEGNDLVQGCRFSVGGGKIEKEAMPFYINTLEIHFFLSLASYFFLYHLTMFIVGIGDLIKKSFSNLIIFLMVWFLQLKI